MDKEFDNSIDYSNKIDLAIDEIFDFVENCKPKAFSATNVVVPKDEMYELIDELRRKVPIEVERCRKMLRNRNEIIRDAQEKAQTIVEDAMEQYNAMVQEHVIVQEAISQAEAVRMQAERDTTQMIQDANAEAERIVRNANAQAQEIYEGAIIYTDELLDMVQSVTEQALYNAQNEYSSLMNYLKSTVETVKANKESLHDTGEESTDVSEEAGGQEAAGQTQTETAHVDQADAGAQKDEKEEPVIYEGEIPEAEQKSESAVTKESDNAVTKESESAEKTDSSTKVEPKKDGIDGDFEGSVFEAAKQYEEKTAEKESPEYEES